MSNKEYAASMAELERENEELKAQNTLLMEELEQHVDNPYCGLVIDMDLDATPSQCLEQIQHDAIIEVSDKLVMAKEYDIKSRYEFAGYMRAEALNILDDAKESKT